MPQLRAWLETGLAALGAFFGHYGYAVLFLGALGENTALLGFFLPGSALALVGGFYARQGTLSLGLVILLTWWGMVLGYHGDYLVGRYILAHAARRWGASTVGRRLRLAPRLRMARALLARHGGKAILLSHVAGHIRSFVALSAGATRMRYRRFLSFELVAALLWSTAFCLVGYFIGGERARLQMVLERAGWVVLAAAALCYLAWRIARPHLRRRALALRRHTTAMAAPSRTAR